MRHLSIAISLCLLLAGNAVMAQEVSIDVAKSRALDFLSRQSIGPKFAKGTTSSTDLKLAYTSKSEAKTCFYVFNVGDDEGFVIAGGDESARQILGYCDHGTFDYDKAPENFKWWLGQYTEQIARAEEPDEANRTDEDVVCTRKTKSKKTRESVEPLIKTKWGQYYPFNSLIPETPFFSFPPTGCVATAMSQIMKYWNYPATGRGGNSYKYLCTYIDELGEYEADCVEFPYVDFSKTTYDWNHMKNWYFTEYSTEEELAVATLMYHAGISVEMEYSNSESCAPVEKIGPALVNLFSYDKSIRYESRGYYSDEEWEDIIYNELKAGRPVIYSGFKSSSGHEFICDGYDSDKEMYSINWGWEGVSDGYYLLTGTNALDGYKYMQEIYVNIKPDEGGHGSPHLAYDDNYTGSFYLKIGDELYENYDYIYTSDDTNLGYLCTSVRNYSVNLYNFNLGVRAIETTTGKTYDLWSIINEYIARWPQPEAEQIDIQFQLNKLEYNGTYELRPIYSDNYSGTYEMDIEKTIKYPTITVSGAKDPVPEDLKFTIESNSLQVSRTLQIEHEGDFIGTIEYSSSNPQIATVDEDGMITGVSEGTVIISAHSEANYYFNETIKSFEITVTKLIKDNVKFFIDGNILSSSMSTQIYWTKDYNGSPIFSSSDENIVTIDSEGLVKAKSIGMAIITALAPATTTFNSNETQFTVMVLDSESPSLVEQSYFNNDNNTYIDDLILHYSIGQTSWGWTSNGAPYIYYTLETNDHIFSSHFQTDYSYMDIDLSGTYDFRNIDNQDLVEHLTVGKQYTIYFFKDKDYNIPYDFYPSVTFTYRDKLTVDYGVSSAGYGTLILPFNAELPEGMTIYSCPSVDENGVLTLVEESSIERNVPYIVKATYGENYHFEGPEAIDDDKPSFQEGILVGAVGKNVTLQKNTDYILQVQDGKAAFYKYTGTKADETSENDSSGNRLAKQFRAFLRPEGSSNAPKFNLPGFSDEETDGISTITSDGHMPAGIYSIDGKRQSEFQKGLNILILEDGTAQKVFVK